MEHHGIERPRLFIGSSTEGKAIAEAVQLNFDGDIAATIWSQGLFNVGSTTVETLERISREFDFAALVISADDVVESRGERHWTPRGNLLVEAGLFVGRLGRDRTFLVCSRDREIQLPSNLAGLTMAQYRLDTGRTIQASLGPACTRLKQAIERIVSSPAPQDQSVTTLHPATRGMGPRPRRKNSLGSACVHGPRDTMRIVNISATGALLESSGELPVGKLLDLDLRLDDGRSIQATAKVVRVQHPAWGRIGGVGVAFTGIDPDSALALEEFVMSGQPAGLELPIAAGATDSRPAPRVGGR